MRPSPRSAYFIVSAFLSLASSTLRAQAPSAPQASSPAVLQLDLPDSPGGLERLAKEIFKAQKSGDSARASALAQTMVLPDPASWYLQTFGPEIAGKEGAKYVNDKDHLPAEILSFFFDALKSGHTELSAARFGETCDDNAGEYAFGTLQLRLQPIPLYELRLRNGNQFLRFFALVYVDGAFRFVLAPKVPDHFPYRPRPSSNSDTPGTAAESRAHPPISRVRQGGNVVAASLMKRVTPEYPHIAREEHLSGTVRMHAIIAKDGSVSELIVLNGYCSLAKSSVEAVKQWRYRPTLFNGEPVEVDTTIDVIFSLNQ